MIVEDELPAASELEHLLARWPRIAVTHVVHHGQDALRLLDESTVDVVFLDVEMPGLSGFEVAEEIRVKPSPPEIVFVTAFDRYAIDAFTVRAADYLLKPIDPARLAETVERLVGAADRVPVLRAPPEGGAAPLLSVPAGGRFVPLYPENIVFATAERRGTTLVTDQGEFHVAEPFGLIVDLMQKDDRFYRSHRSFVVNMHRVVSVHISRYGTYDLCVECTERTVPVSRGSAPDFRKRMKISR